MSGTSNKGNASAKGAATVEGKGNGNVANSNPTKAELLKQLLAEVSPEEMEQVGEVIRDKQKLVQKAVADAERKAKEAEAEAKRKKAEQDHEIEVREFMKGLAELLTKMQTEKPAKEDRWNAKNVREVITAELKKLPKVKGEKGGKGGRKGGGGGGNRSKGNGVIDHIQKAITDAGQAGITKVEILEKLAAEFPERDKDSMKVTINAQVPTRLNSSRDMNIQNIGEGVYVNMETKKAS
jgi:hypothetical protein